MNYLPMNWKFPMMLYNAQTKPGVFKGAKSIDCHSKHENGLFVGLYPISRKYSSAEKFAIFATLGS